jgi:hypothetical protein
LLRKSLAIELFILATAIGLLATFAAPWVELRGTFQSWRIVELHTFWRGEGAFQLAQVVAPGYVVPVEFATTGMRDTLRTLFAAGTILGIWHTLALAGLLYTGVGWRNRGMPRGQMGVQVGLVLLIVVAVLSAFTILLALPSSLSMKVDFRAPTDLHSDSLIWSDLSVLPVGPVLAILAVVIQIIGAWSTVVGGRRKASREKCVF